MNARDGMKRLWDEGRAYGMRMNCGTRLEPDYKFKTCLVCRLKYREWYKRAKEKRKAKNDQICNKRTAAQRNILHKG